MIKNRLKFVGQHIHSIFIMDSQMLIFLVPTIFFSNNDVSICIKLIIFMIIVRRLNFFYLVSLLISFKASFTILRLFRLVSLGLLFIASAFFFFDLQYIVIFKIRAYIRVIFYIYVMFFFLSTYRIPLVLLRYPSGL